MLLIVVERISHLLRDDIVVLVQGWWRRA